MGMAVGGSGGFNSDINVTPMVDVMLVVLIIFMVVTPLLQSGVTVALPKNLNNPEEDQRIIKETSVVVAVTNDDKYFVGKDEVDKATLETKVTELMAEVTKSEDRIVYIKGDAQANYGNVVEAVNAIRKAGIDRIGLVADKKKGGDTAPVARPAA
ncbi:MAG: biopolymer transporter ExbD [Pyrinomonadaceae bacterium MAG19_C2-C3]|nr:biopolymer transporter ExbD [Pyrinomonadaceae bacterium MAG19_C2-C3]